MIYHFNFKHSNLSHSHAYMHKCVCTILHTHTSWCEYFHIQSLPFPLFLICTFSGIHAHMLVPICIAGQPHTWGRCDAQGSTSCNGADGSYCFPLHTKAVSNAAVLIALPSLVTLLPWPSISLPHKAQLWAISYHRLYTINIYWSQPALGQSAPYRSHLATCNSKEKDTLSKYGKRQKKEKGRHHFGFGLIIIV